MWSVFAKQQLRWLQKTPTHPISLSPPTLFRKNAIPVFLQEEVSGDFAAGCGAVEVEVQKVQNSFFCRAAAIAALKDTRLMENQILLEPT